MSTILLLLSMCLKVFTVYFVAVALFALKRHRPFPPAERMTRFAVVVAARNEEAVIGDMIHSVLSQDYPAELRDMYVIPNNCTDFTEAVARAAGARIIACPGHVKGKGEALSRAFENLRGMGYDAYLVFDADNILDPGYLSRINDAVAAGAQVFKGRLMAANPQAGAVAGCYGLYNAGFDIVWNRPRSACGLSAKLVGTGFGFTREVLEDLGGWNTVTIAEDAEFSARCAKKGYRVRWVPEAVSYDEEPVSFAVSLRQRKRWCSGVMQVARRELAGLRRGDKGSAALRLDMAMFLLAPFVQALSGLCLMGGTALALVEGNGERMAAVIAGCVIYLVGGMFAGLFLSAAGGYSFRNMAGAILLFPIFMASWLPLQIVSLFKDTRTWHPMVHIGSRAAAHARR